MSAIGLQRVVSIPRETGAGDIQQLPQKPEDSGEDDNQLVSKKMLFSLLYHRCVNICAEMGCAEILLYCTG